MKLTAVNVWQWDCYILDDLPESCSLKMKSWSSNYELIKWIIVDAWPACENYNLIKEMKEDRYILCLTHNHTDHIWWVNNIFLNKKIEQIKELWVPAFANQFVSLVNYVYDLWEKYLPDSNNFYLQKNKLVIDSHNNLSLIDLKCFLL